MSSKEHNWGILSTGKIAADFVKALQFTKGAKVVAVTSRSIESANSFADKFNIPKRYGHIKEFLADKEINNVYVASLHPFHKEQVIACLEAGKNVLCEKPITLNSNDTKDLIELARKKNLLLMEAMWTRCFPSTEKVRQLIRDGVIGDVRAVLIDFGLAHHGKERLIDIEQGGGATLDIGIYTIAYASMIFGCHPEKIQALGYIGNTSKVDEAVSVSLLYPQGRIANLYYSITAATQREARIVGEKASIRVHFPFHCSTLVTLEDHEGKVQSFEFPLPPENDTPGVTWNFKNSVGLKYEAEHFQHLVEQNKKESDLYPLDESLGVSVLMDEVRNQIGMVYPVEGDKGDE